MEEMRDFLLRLSSYIDSSLCKECNTSKDYVGYLNYVENELDEMAFELDKYCDNKVLQK